MGGVVARQEEGRKVYAITDEGRRFLAERGERVDDIRERMHRWHGGWPGDEIGTPLQALRDLGRMLGGRRGPWDLDADKARRIGEVIARARRDIEAILAERPAAADTAPETAPASGAAASPERGAVDGTPGVGRRPEMI
jgi:hypothetical protein